jgi:serine/threonine protein kinase/tetratricopeptide (TPR) repeat protein
MTANFDKLREIFFAALEQPPDQRKAYLDEHCAGDESLRHNVAVMLKAHAAEEGPLDRGSWRHEHTAAYEQPTEAPGAVIGPYKLLEQIGGGGMGLVFVAEQERPVRRRVALKIIKPGMDSRQVIARFEAERQALAMMDHPNIAKVHDGGTTPDGRPYFVMEYVKGTPITEYCDKHRLNTRQRLELFVNVCSAVQHAHQKGIIHRDIKPSNVLVSLHDVNPVVKVIDFGIAKATTGPLTDKTVYTAAAQMIGTPLYMSPEQAGLSDLDVDTRSDVYSLGVLLYELLTGTTPFDSETLKQAGYDEMRRIIREDEPPRPSARLGTMHQAQLSTIAEQRRLEPHHLSRHVRGELDWIVMRALEKDRNRRYESASAFAADVQRYLNDEPVQACPPSVSYRLSKFARRYKTSLAFAGLTMFFLVLVGSAVGWLISDRATRHREAENKIREAMETVRPLLLEGNPADPALLSAAQRIETELARGTVKQEVRGPGEQLLRDVHMLADLNEIRLRRAESKEGIDVLALDAATAASRIRASAICEALLAGLDDWMDSKTRGEDFFEKINLDPDAERSHLRQVADAADDNSWRRAFRKAAFASDGKQLKKLASERDVLDQPAAVIACLGSVLHSHHFDAEAVTVLRQAQQQHPADFWINYLLGHTLLLCSPSRQSPEQALGYCRAAVAIRPTSAEAISLLGVALLRTGDTDRAIAAYQQALHFDPTFPRARENLGFALISKGDVEGGIACFRKVFELGSKNAEAHCALGGNYLTASRPDDAIACYHAALTLDPKNAKVHTGMGMAMERKGKLDEAIRWHEKAVALAPKVSGAHNLLGISLANKGRLDAAITEFLKAVELDPDSAAHHINLGRALARKGRLDEAIDRYCEALELEPNSSDAYYNLGIALKNAKRLDDAIDCWEEGVQRFPNNGRFHIGLAEVLELQRKHDYASAEFRKAMKLDPNSRTAIAWAKNNVAWSWATRRIGTDQDPVQAVKLAEEAIELLPQEAGMWNTLGVAHYRATDYMACIKALNKSMSLAKGGTSFDWFFLAMAEWQLGNKEKARSWYDKAVAWMEKESPQDEQLRRFQLEAAELLMLDEAQLELVPPPQELP